MWGALLCTHLCGCFAVQVLPHLERTPDSTVPSATSMCPRQQQQQQQVPVPTSPYIQQLQDAASAWQQYLQYKLAEQQQQQQQQQHKTSSAVSHMPGPPNNSDSRGTLGKVPTTVIAAVGATKPSVLSHGPAAAAVAAGRAAVQAGEGQLAPAVKLEQQQQQQPAAATPAAVMVKTKCAAVPEQQQACAAPGATGTAAVGNTVLLGAAVRKQPTSSRLVEPRECSRSRHRSRSHSTSKTSSSSRSRSREGRPQARSAGGGSSRGHSRSRVRTRSRSRGSGQHRHSRGRERSLSRSRSSSGSRHHRRRRSRHRRRSRSSGYRAHSPGWSGDRGRSGLPPLSPHPPTYAPVARDAHEMMLDEMGFNLGDRIRRLRNTLSLPMAMRCIPPPLANLVFDCPSLTIQKVIHDHLPHFQVIRKHTGVEFVHHRAQPRQQPPTCPFWSPVEMRGCPHRAGCPDRHDLPPRPVLW
jgi:hypothetical protein